MKVVCDQCGANIHAEGGPEAAAVILAKHKLDQHTSAEKTLADKNAALVEALTIAREAFAFIANGKNHLDVDLKKSDMQELAQMNFDILEELLGS